MIWRFPPFRKPPNGETSWNCDWTVWLDMLHWRFVDGAWGTDWGLQYCPCASTYFMWIKQYMLKITFFEWSPPWNTVPTILTKFLTYHLEVYMAYLFILFSSDILSGILSGINFDILSGILSGIYSDILYGVPGPAVRWGPAVHTEIWSSQLCSEAAGGEGVKRKEEEETIETLTWRIRSIFAYIYIYIFIHPCPDVCICTRIWSNFNTCVNFHLKPCIYIYV